MEKRELELWRREKFQELPNVKRRRTLEFCYFATSKALQLASICVCAPIITHFCPFPMAALHQDPGGTEYTPIADPFPLFPPTDPLSDGPLFTFTLLHGPAGPRGRTNRYIIVWSSFVPPPFPTRADPIHSAQKHHLYHPTVRQ